MRCRTHVKQQVMDAIVGSSCGSRSSRESNSPGGERMRGQMFQQFGGQPPQDMDLKSLLPDEMFKEQAERRVRLGLIAG